MVWESRMTVRDHPRVTRTAGHGLAPGVPRRRRSQRSKLPLQERLEGRQGRSRPIFPAQGGAVGVVALGTGSCLDGLPASPPAWQVAY